MIVKGIVLSMVSLFIISCSVLKNTSHNYKKLELNDNYDTTYVIYDESRSTISDIRLTNSEGIVIIEDWYDNYGYGNYKKHKFFSYEGTKYQEVWHYKDDCLTKIVYYADIEKENSGISYAWKGGRKIKNCGNVPKLSIR